MTIFNNGSTDQGSAGLSRRRFIQLGGAGVAAYGLLDSTHQFEMLAQAEVTPMNTADAVIFIKLAGAPSHMDTFDIKEGAWTPADFDIQDNGDISLPNRLFPNLLKQADKLSILRSVQAWVPVHPIAQYWIDTSQDFNAALAPERPAVGAVMALEFQSQRSAEDVFPGFVALIGSPAVGNGFLNGLVAPFPIAGGNPQGAGRLVPAAGVSGLTHPRGQDDLERFYSRLLEIDAENRRGNPPWGKPLQDYNDFFNAAKGMMYNPAVVEAFQYTDADREPYGKTTFGDAMLVARKMVEANKGTKFVHVTFTGWDMHAGIYQGAASLYNRCPVLDAGLGQLLLDMSNKPSPTRPGKTMLDTTLVVAMGEFGRTPPNRYGPTGLSSRGGRDHYANVQFAVMAGGGVKGGRVIGKTDQYGAVITDPGWQYRTRGGQAGPYIRMEDIGVTMYSAMNINWTKEIFETPSRRVYQYISGGPNTVYKEVRELFT
ncbi:MAG: DUF1501 domain-containing protein [Acidobacteria bacterium]|nr:DUF1501 domain-containing protein [Acidobacteriota bacterium]